MSFYEGKRDNTVLPALKKRGAVMYLLLRSGDTFDEVTGETTVDTAPTKTKVWGLELKSKVKEFKHSSTGAVVRKTVKQVMISAGDNVSPVTEMTLKIGTTEYEIISVVPFSPGGLPVYYDLEVTV